MQTAGSRFRGPVWGLAASGLLAAELKLAEGPGARRNCRFDIPPRARGRGGLPWNETTAEGRPTKASVRKLGRGMQGGPVADEPSAAGLSVTPLGRPDFGCWPEPGPAAG